VVPVCRSTGPMQTPWVELGVLAAGQVVPVLQLTTAETPIQEDLPLAGLDVLLAMLAAPLIAVPANTIGWCLLLRTNERWRTRPWRTWGTSLAYGVVMAITLTPAVMMAAYWLQSLR
jgi:hypothetical protein